MAIEVVPRAPLTRGAEPVAARPGADPETPRDTYARPGGLRPQVRRALAVVPLALMIAWYAAHFAEMSVTNFRAYAVPAFDFGIFDQGIWLLSRFHDPFVTIMGRDLLGDHSSYVLLLLAPLYWVYPHSAALFVVQSLFIALGAVPVFLVARHFGAGYVMATLLGGSYLLNPAVQQVTLEGFHPECFLPFFVGMAVYGAIVWKRGLLLAMVVLTLLVKEDAALLLVPIGLWTAWRRDRRWGVGIVSGAVAWSLLMPLVVMPAISGFLSPSDEGRLPFGGVSGFLHTLAPSRMLAYLRAQGRPFYLWQMLAPSGLVFLVAPEVAAMSLFVLAGNYLSPDPYEQQIVYHYSLAPAAVLLLGSAFAIAKMRGRALKAAGTAAVVVSSVLACAAWGALPFSRHPPYVGDPGSAQNAANRALVAMVPRGAAVSADVYLVAHLDHRAQIYLWPTPFDTGYYGSGVAEDGKRLPVARRIQYLLLGLPLSSQDRATFDSIDRSFRLVKLIGSVALFERVRPPSPAATGGASS